MTPASTGTDGGWAGFSPSKGHGVGEGVSLTRNFMLSSACFRCWGVDPKELYGAQQPGGRPGPGAAM